MYKAATDIFRRASEQQIELLSENISRFSNQLKRLSNLKKPEDFLNLQREFASENMSATIDAMQKSVRTLLENMDELTKACTNSYQTNTTSSKMTTEKSER